MQVVIAYIQSNPTLQCIREAKLCAEVSVQEHRKPAAAGMQASSSACAGLNTCWCAQVRLLRLNDCGNMFGKPGSFNARLRARLEHLQVRLHLHPACTAP